jgi:two-component sensor histidine kinase
LATGLLAGVPAAIGAACASLLIIVWAFMPPYFQFKGLTPAEQLNVFFNAVPYFITVYFAHCCRVVLQRLHRREQTNEILANELRHRARNLFSVIQAVVQKTLADLPDRAEKITGRLRSILYANELLVSGKSESIAVKDLLLQELAPYGENRLQMRGPDLEIEPENARHLLLLFHELVTNAAKYGSLSRADGQVLVEWQRNNGHRVALTWKEVGGPAVERPSNAGFGSQLMSLCIKSLDGTMQSEYLPDGFACMISLDIDARH